MPTLLRMRRVAGSESQGIRRSGVDTGFASASGVVVLTNENGVGQYGLEGTGRRLHLESDLRIQIAGVEAVEVDLENAADVGLVVRVDIKLDAIDLDRAVISRGIPARGAAAGRPKTNKTSDIINRITPAVPVVRLDLVLINLCLQFASPLRKGRSHHWLASSQVPAFAG